MNILFDLDGTIIDPIMGFKVSVDYAFNQMKIPVPDNLEQYIGPPLHETFANLLSGFPKDVLQQTIAYYREKYAEVGVEENRLYSGIENLLFSCQQSGHRVFIATSKPQVFAEKIIENLALTTFFEKVYGSQLDGVNAKKADLIAFILKEEGLVAEESVMIGDRKYDLIGAKANAMRAIAVSWGYGSEDELDEEGPLAICSNTGELLEVIESIAKD